MMPAPVVFPLTADVFKLVEYAIAVTLSFSKKKEMSVTYSFY